MAEQTSGLFWKDKYAEAVEPELTPVEKQLRDLFVTHYLRTCDPIEAAICCGFARGYAQQYADQFMNEPYVVLSIADRRRETEEPDNQAKEHRALIISVLIQASQNGPYASRVAAVKELNAMHGFTKHDNNVGEQEAMIAALREFAQKAPV